MAPNLGQLPKFCDGEVSGLPPIDHMEMMQVPKTEVDAMADTALVDAMTSEQVDAALDEAGIDMKPAIKRLRKLVDAAKKRKAAKKKKK